MAHFHVLGLEFGPLLSFKQPTLIGNLKDPNLHLHTKLKETSLPFTEQLCRKWPFWP